MSSAGEVGAQVARAVYHEGDQAYEAILAADWHLVEGMQGVMAATDGTTNESVATILRLYREQRGLLEQALQAGSQLREEAAEYLRGIGLAHLIQEPPIYTSGPTGIERETQE